MLMPIATAIVLDAATTAAFDALHAHRRHRKKVRRREQTTGVPVSRLAVVPR